MPNPTQRHRLLQPGERKRRLFPPGRQIEQAARRERASVDSVQRTDRLAGSAAVEDHFGSGFGSTCSRDERGGRRGGEERASVHGEASWGGIIDQVDDGVPSACRSMR